MHLTAKHHAQEIIENNIVFVDCWSVVCWLPNYQQDDYWSLLVRRIMSILMESSSMHIWLDDILYDHVVNDNLATSSNGQVG
jgi:hypothetical protein